MKLVHNILSISRKSGVIQASDQQPVDCHGMQDVSDLLPTDNTSDIFYYHPNHLSSSMYVTDMQQSVVQSFLYAPYGDIISEYNPGFNGNVLPNYAFNAKELDEETGMYYYEARYYAPPVFISRDPLMSEKPWLTPYHYCSNNPVGKTDPSGKKDRPFNVQYDKKINIKPGTATLICKTTMFGKTLFYSRQSQKNAYNCHSYA